MLIHSKYGRTRNSLPQRGWVDQKIKKNHLTTMGIMIPKKNVVDRTNALRENGGWAGTVVTLKKRYAS
jgi:hypothetical protein